MAHLRSTVTDAVVARIGTNGVTVEKTRVYPTSAGDLPRYIVYKQDEENVWDHSVGRIMRRLRLSVEVLLTGSTATIEDTLDSHCEYIEDRLNPAGSIANTLRSRVLSTDFEEVDTGNVAMMTAKLTVEVAYVTLTSDAAAAA